MKALFKRDFIAYFTSPIGYIYIGAYIFVLNLMFYQANILGSVSSVSSIFSFMLSMLMFLTPILTMRVFSEDFKQKTDQLLITSPVKSYSIVAGKFFSSLAVFLCLLALTLLWPAVISVFGENNMSEVLGNYLGILCIGCAYISMGIFISSLTENQVIAAVGSLALFVALYLLEILALSFYTSGALPVFVMQILLFISVFGRYNDISRGLLSLDTIVFFLSLCAVFIFLTIRVLERRKTGQEKTGDFKLKGFSLLTACLFIAALVLLNIFAQMLTERFFLRADMTDTGIYTLSERAEQYLQGVNERVDIIVLEDETTWLANSTYALAVRILENYEAQTGGRIRVQYVNPDLNTFSGPQYNNSLTELKESHTELEDMQRGDIIFLSARRATKIFAADLFIRQYDSASGRYVTGAVNADHQLISSLQYVLNETIARAVFTVNHQENSSENLKMIFERSGYVCQDINFATEDIPDDTLIIIAAAPRTDFLINEVEKLEQFLTLGGNAMILYDYNVSALPLLDVFLEEWGIRIEQKLIMDSDHTYVPQLGIIGAHAVAGAMFFTVEAENATRNELPLGVFLPRPLKPAWVGEASAGFTIYPLIQTFGNSSYAKDLTDGEAITLERQSSDESGPFVLAYNTRRLVVNRGGAQTFANLIVTGANMFEDNFMATYGSSFYNFLFIADIAGELNPFSAGLYIPEKQLFDNRMAVSSSGARSVLVTMVIMLPLAIVASGVIVWRRRRNL